MPPRYGGSRPLSSRSPSIASTAPGGAATSPPAPRPHSRRRWRDISLASPELVDFPCPHQIIVLLVQLLIATQRCVCGFGMIDALSNRRRVLWPRERKRGG